MTAMHIILIILGSLIFIFFLISFFLPDNKSLDRSIVINRPASQVYSLIADFSNYKKWNPWSAKEPEAKGEMSGEPGEIGHKWMWDGKKIGKGYLQIREIKENEKIISDLVFLKPRSMENDDIWTFEPIGESQTKVTWGHYSELAYPVARYFGLMLDKWLGPDFEQGLKNLKELSESNHGNT